eukprot:3860999-Rhodomonas_salina.2
MKGGLACLLRKHVLDLPPRRDLLHALVPPDPRVSTDDVVASYPRVSTDAVVASYPQVSAETEPQYLEAHSTERGTSGGFSRQVVPASAELLAGTARCRTRLPTPPSASTPSPDSTIPRRQYQYTILLRACAQYHRAMVLRARGQYQRIMLPRASALRSYAPQCYAPTRSRYEKSVPGPRARALRAGWGAGTLRSRSGT